MALLAALWPMSCCTSSTSSVGNSGPLGGGAIGNPGEGPKRGREEKGWAPGWTILNPLQCFWGPAQSVVAPLYSSLHGASLFLYLAAFSTVLPGGCPACDTRALEGALLCMKHHYETIPLPNGTSFNGSRTFLENAADIGGLAIALQVTPIPGARIC